MDKIQIMMRKGYKGVNPMPEIACHWSKDSWYANPSMPKEIARERFQIPYYKVFTFY